MQVLARPATGSRLRRARRAIRHLRYRRPARLTSRLLDALTPGGHATARRAGARADPELAAGLRAATAKAAAPQWETQIRYAVTTTAVAGRGRVRRTAAGALARRRLRGLAHALASATALYAGRNWLARRHLPRPAAQIADRRFRAGDLLSVTELAAIARLPADALVPGLARAGARAVPPSPGIPGPGPDARPLGVTDTGTPRPVAIAVPDARHHLRIIGATGAGKTTLILGQLLADTAAGRGAVFIDPKGDAITDLLPRLPEQIAGKVVLFDPAGRGAPPCLNVLQGDPSSADVDVITDNITGIFRRIFAAFWGQEGRRLNLAAGPKARRAVLESAPQPADPPVGVAFVRQGREQGCPIAGHLGQEPGLTRRPGKCRTSVALAGDAAHAMTPRPRAGRACQALEDAVVLAKVLDSGLGLGAYDRQRRPRTQMIARRAHRIGVAAQWESPVAVGLRNTALRLLPPSSLARSLAPVLDWAA